MINGFSTGSSGPNDGGIVGNMLTQPVASENDIDMEFIAKLLGDISWWIHKKKVSENMMPDDNQFGEQPLGADFGPRSMADPMSNWIAGIGRAQV